MDALHIHNVTALHSVRVGKSMALRTVDDLQKVIKSNTGTISIGGGRYSMGGQIASEDSLHIDMREFNRILEFSPEQKTIRVQAGVRWRDIQEHVDSHNLSVKIMQTYANFTVGGSLSVNVHGRYIGLGPLILSVRSISVVLANGELVEATPSQNAEVFYGVIGGYGGLGVIVAATLDLAQNLPLERKQKKMPVGEYLAYFSEHVRNAGQTVFHNADLYPPSYTHARAVSWVKTDKQITVPHRLKPWDRKYVLERYFIWAFTETPFGAWRREHIIDPLLYLSHPVVWRNYEASYNVVELEPVSREKTTYVLQEYFVPIGRFDEFVPKMAEILQRYRVNALNISVRHAYKDPGALLAWAREEVFAFVLYYKQHIAEAACNEVAVWTRELVDATLSCGGSYYLPYQPHATPEQFHKAYPHAEAFFALKAKLDPEYKFRNKLWDKYHMQNSKLKADAGEPNSDFHAIYDDVVWQDKFYLFLQNVYRIYPEGKFHTLIIQACQKYQTDKEIYTYLQKELPTIKSALSDIRYGIPALIKQKKVMAQQTVELLDRGKTINGYVEIGSTGRYISTLRKHFTITDSIYLVNDQAPSNSPVDIVERGGIKKIGQFIPLDNYNPHALDSIPDASIDVVTCYIGLHHAPLDRLDGFVRSLWRVLRKEGSLIVRDHDVDSAQMRAFVSLAHTVFNAGLGVAWEINASELRHWTSAVRLVSYLQERGFQHNGKKLLQNHDPSINMLMQFVKTT